MPKFLRQLDFRGEIVVITNEFFAPYYKEKIYSLAVSDTGVESRVKTPEFYKSNRIKIIKNNKIKKITPETHTIEFEDGHKIKYSKMLFATGHKSRKERYPGHNLENVFQLTNLEDMIRIRRRLASCRSIVIVGGTHRAVNFALNAKKKYANL